MDRSIKKSQTVRRRQTIDTAQGRQYASRRHHQTPLKQLQSMFWPSRNTYHSTINNNHHHQLHEQQMPMINQNQTKTVQRSSSVREKTSTVNS